MCGPLQEARAEEFMRRVESDMAAMRQRALQLAGLLKGRDRQLTTLRGGSEAAQAEQEKVHDRLRQASTGLHHFCNISMRGLTV